MKAMQRIDLAISRALHAAEAGAAPRRLAAAIRHAVLPGGARIRPQLTLAVAWACGDDAPELADGAAAALELMHCASLVHDDLPCFDDAALRRGRPSVVAAYGERCAVLAGDALIVMAFEALSVGALHQPHRLPALMSVLIGRVGMPSGIVAGQGWECEDWVALPDYQRAKTGSLFAAATAMGALAAGVDPAPWRGFGEHLGEAYQIADDIRDVLGDEQTIGKPVSRDRTLGRPNAVAEHGLAGALASFEDLIDRAGAAVPEGSAARALRALVHAEAERLLPLSLRAQALPLATAAA